MGVRVGNICSGAAVLCIASSRTPHGCWLSSSLPRTSSSSTAHPARSTERTPCTHSLPEHDATQTHGSTIIKDRPWWNIFIECSNTCCVHYDLDLLSNCVPRMRWWWWWCGSFKINISEILSLGESRLLICSGPTPSSLSSAYKQIC